MLKSHNNFSNTGNSNDTDDNQIVSQELENVNLKSRENLHIYLGTLPYTITYSSNDIEKLTQYISHIINYAWNFIETSQFTSLFDNASSIAINMVSTILKYNNFPGIDKCPVLVTENNILLSEPIVVMTNQTKMMTLHDNKDNASENQLCVMVSQKLLRECWKVCYMPQVSFDDVTRYETYQDFVNFTHKNMNEIPMQKELLQIFVVADHAASHCMEELAFHNTDYINHINFAESFYTVHSQLRIKCKINAKKSPFNIFNNVNL
ncbi:uncharacterized LOC118071229 [Chelonus insularis]|uniref:uncharacterized LOC118071229 n=1 Tax=Chelonus insularis TaxID=460826 RepID=UPI00158A73EC|nr:uncharacterized LOC118071229 [Chelonus insularis]KAG8148331.1 HzNVorf106-like protein [Chelonus insularis]